MKLQLVLAFLIYDFCDGFFPVKLGDLCFSDGDCKDVPGAVCAADHCECQTGYTIVRESKSSVKCVKCSGETPAVKTDAKPQPPSQTKPESKPPPEPAKPGGGSLPQGTCGTPAVSPSITLKPTATSKHRIVGGTPALNCSYPYQVFVKRQKPGYSTFSMCGGSIYNDWYILTAAHCSEPGTLPSHFEITLGTNDRTDRSSQKIGVEKIILHKSYININKGYDIMLLKLKNKIQFNACVQPICIPTEDLPGGTLCVATGWGLLSSEGKSSEVLRQVALPIVTAEVCFDRNHYNALAPPFTVCAGYEEGGKDACQGDSGGPLACVHSDNRYYLHGITSGGKGCGVPRQPGIYTKVTDYLDWIKQNAV